MPSREFQLTDIKPFNDLRTFSKENALTFSIEYSEAEDCYYGNLTGAGIGEDIEVKRYYSIETVCEELLSTATLFYQSLKENKDAKA